MRYLQRFRCWYFDVGSGFKRAGAESPEQQCMAMIDAELSGCRAREILCRSGLGERSDWNQTSDNLPTRDALFTAAELS